MKNNNTPPSASNPIKPLPFPVPWVFVLTYLIGVGLQYIIPIPIHGSDIIVGSRVAGIVLLVWGLSLAAWSLIIFQSNHTTTSPVETSSKLVTWGPYRFSRNPMYVSLLLIYIGEAGVLIQVWPLLLLLLTLAYLQWIVIPYEEKQLERNFGNEYRQYCAHVRRWI
jgi:protein-S-isoprenylcysteine O-methyltransferase Ste14